MRVRLLVTRQGTYTPYLQESSVVSVMRRVVGDTRRRRVLVQYSPKSPLPR